MRRSDIPEAAEIFTIDKGAAFAPAAQIQKHVRGFVNLNDKFIEGRDAGLIVLCKIDLFHIVQLQTILLPAGMEMQIKHKAALDALALMRGNQTGAVIDASEVLY